ncbi:ankyrin repeat-containing domain protein [Aspergillus leporis]|uniref:Ankyrin repeat-containing domain protein n=1 Tax=Aspergillus leporis TaxID=41062 RepID=A0A5N5X7R1_9EURO|nr:ankyrin repeat-containing domain protein [Aspergillus leporis]
MSLPMEGKDRKNRTPLWLAADTGYEIMVKLLLERNVDPSSPNIIGATLLFMAAASGNLSVVETLLAQPRVNPASEGMVQCTPLLVVVHEEHEAVVKLLMEPIRTDDNNEIAPRALRLAAFIGYTEVVDVLLDYTHDTNAEDFDDALTTKDGGCLFG